MAGVLLPVANILQALTNTATVLAGGKIYTYVAGTTTNQATYKENTLSTQHSNPIVLDSAGRLTSPVWATAGQTFKIVFKTSADVQIGPDFDNISGINDTSGLGVQYWAGTAGGTANALTVTFSDGPASWGQGDSFVFQAASTNTGSATLNPNGLGAKTLKKEDGRDLIGGEIITSRYYRAIYDGTNARLEAFDGDEGIRTDVASAATVNLDTADSRYVRITGTTTITAITLADGREADVVFGGALILTHGASLLLFGSSNITTVAGDTARFRGEASGVVRLVSYARGSVVVGATPAYLDRNQSFTAAQGVNRSALTDAATIAVDASLSNVFTVTLGGNRTLGQPTNPKDGQGITIFITQDGTGSRTLAYHADWLWPSGADPVLTTTAGAVDVLSAVYNGATTKWYAVLNKAFA